MSHIKRRDFINGSAVAISNSDSAPAADAIEAMRMGYRAVKEIKLS